MNYPYANGTIKVIEANILDKNKLSKLINLSQNDIIKTLIDLGYGNPESKSIEELIAYEVKSTRDLFSQITPDKFHTNLFYTANDAVNIKFFYKKKIFNVESFNIYSDAGTISKDDLEKAIFKDDFSNLSKPLAKLFININEEVAKLQNSRLISAKIDNLIYDFILKQNKNNSLKVYFNTCIDIANIMTFVRSKKLGWASDEFLDMFVNGGNIPKEAYIKAYDSVDIPRVFMNFYSEKVSYGLKAYLENHDLNQLEMYFDKLLINIMKEYRYDSFDIGPMLYYYLIKEAEAKNIRLLYNNSNLDLNDLLDY